MFIRKVSRKNQNGTEAIYAQLVENYRTDDGKIRHRNIANLGRIDGPENMQRLESMAKSLINTCENFQLLELAKDLTAESSKEFGPYLVFRRVFEELGIGEVMGNCLSSVASDFDIVESLFNMMLNRLTEPGSKRQMTLWEQGVEGVKNFELHQYYRALDYLIDNKDEIERCTFYQMRDLFHQELDIVLFDTTSLVYYGEGSEKGEDGEKPEDAKLLDYGFSKARRGDLKQVVVGVLMSKEGIPLGHEVFSGNTNDVRCFSEIIEKIKEKFGLSRVVMVGDRGMISKKNLQELNSSEFEYILGFRMRTISKEERKSLLSKGNLRGLRNSELQFKEVSYQGQRLIVCYNEERAQKDKDFREREVEKLRQKIKSGNMKSLIGNPFYRKFLKGTSQKPQIDEEKLKMDELYDGVFVLTTNTKLSAMQTVERYKDLWQVESAFRQLKSELEMGPIYHWKDRRIRAHIMICFLAFCLKVSLYKKLKIYFKDKKFSYSQLMVDLKALHAIELKVKGKTVFLRTELKSGANQIFQAIGMRPPNRILKTDINTVVQRLH